MVTAQLLQPVKLLPPQEADEQPPHPASVPIPQQVLVEATPFVTDLMAGQEAGHWETPKSKKEITTKMKTKKEKCISNSSLNSI